MDDFRIEPPLLVKDQPKPRRLASLADARAFVDEAMKVGRPRPGARSIIGLRLSATRRMLMRQLTTCVNCSNSKTFWCSRLQKAALESSRPPPRWVIDSKIAIDLLNDAPADVIAR